MSGTGPDKNASYATLTGTIDPAPPKEELARLLADAGLRVTAGRYSIRLDEAEHFVIRNCGGDLGPPQVTADSASTEGLADLARRVSAALGRHAIRHRFELYGPDDRLAEYFHHAWPTEDPA
jgi:hypothetical protein